MNQHISLFRLDRGPAPSYDDPSGAAFLHHHHNTEPDPLHHTEATCTVFVVVGRQHREPQGRGSVLNTPRLVDVVTPYSAYITKASVDEGHRHLDLLEMHHEEPAAHHVVDDDELRAR